MRVRDAHAVADPPHVSGSRRSRQYAHKRSILRCTNRTWPLRSAFTCKEYTVTPNQIASHQMPTSLRGRLRNTSLPKTKALLPLFEAIVNSIHAIDDAQLSSAAGHIAIHVIRSPQFEFDDTKTTSGIVGFRVTDNGIGFDKSNMDSFRVLDSDYKIERGGRGIGRLLWLKAFRIVHVESTFVDHDGHTRRRCFKFSADRGVYDDEISSSTLDTGPSTTVHLDGFEEKYRPQSRTTPTALAHHVLEHCHGIIFATKVHRRSVSWTARRRCTLIESTTGT